MMTLRRRPSTETIRFGEFLFAAESKPQGQPERQPSPRTAADGTDSADDVESMTGTGGRPRTPADDLPMIS